MLGKLNSNVFLPMEQLRRLTLTPEQEAWLYPPPRHQLVAPFDAPPERARIITALFFDWLVERHHEENKLVCQAPFHLDPAPSSKRFPSRGAGWWGKGAAASTGTADAGVRTEAAYVTATQADVDCHARLVALGKYASSLRLFLVRNGYDRTPLLVDNVDVLEYRYFFHSSRDDPLYREMTSKLHEFGATVWKAGKVKSCVAILVSFASIHHEPDVRRYIFSAIDFERKTFVKCDLRRDCNAHFEVNVGKALEELDEDPGLWFTCIKPLMINKVNVPGHGNAKAAPQPLIRQRMERCEIRATSVGQRPEDNWKKLRMYGMHESGAPALDVTPPVDSLHGLASGLKAMPKDDAFVGLRRALIVREVGNADPDIVCSGEGFSLNDLPSASEFHKGMNVASSHPFGDFGRHLERIDTETAKIADRYGEELPASVTTSLSQMHDRTCLESDREAPVCEVLRETRDLHALVVDGRGRGVGVKGREHRSVSDGCVDRLLDPHLQGVVKRRRVNINLKLHRGGEESKVRTVLRTIFTDYFQALRDATTLVHHQLRRTKKKEQRQVHLCTIWNCTLPSSPTFAHPL